MTTIKKYKQNKKNTMTATLEKVFYGNFNTRMNTMKHAPESIKNKAIEMAATGLFYGNYGDYVKCHACSTRFGKWVDSDDPAELHERASPNCPFILTIKRNTVRSLHKEIRNEFPNLIAEIHFQTKSFQLWTSVISTLT